MKPIIHLPLLFYLPISASMLMLKKKKSVVLPGFFSGSFSPAIWSIHLHITSRNCFIYFPTRIQDHLLFGTGIRVYPPPSYILSWLVSCSEKAAFNPWHSLWIVSLWRIIFPWRLIFVSVSTKKSIIFYQIVQSNMKRVCDFKRISGNFSFESLHGIIWSWIYFSCQY